MGKGYNNYMCKKPFHPGSKANIKRAWMAEQKTENDKKKQDELKVQYEKEQDLYKNRALISSESKDKLELNFMYEAPPGAKREHQKEDDEPEYKFEWQRKYNAPREDYAKGNADIKDQPFGIPVRNVRCIKCHKWGHINTDKECPLFSQASTSSMPTTSMDPMELMRQMREDGYGLKENVLGHHLNPKAANQQLIPSDESDPEADFLKSLSTAEKKKLLRKLKKLSKKQEKMARSKKKKSKKAKKSTDSSDSDSDDKKKHKKKKQKECTSLSSESSSSDEDREHRVSKQKPNDTNLSSKDERRNRSSKSNVQDSDCERNTHSKESKRSKHSARENFISYRLKKDSKLKCDIKERQHQEKSENKRPKNVEESKADIKTNWKSNYSSSSTEDEESIVVNQKVTKENRAKKHKTETSTSEESVKRIKTGKLDAKDARMEQDSEKINHPDGFSHTHPQAIIEANYVQDQEEYTGKIHDRFRDLHRDERSPSVKQKYNK